MIRALLITLVAFSLTGCSVRELRPDERNRLEANSRAALESLYQSSPAAKSLGESAHGILVIPRILSGGFIFGGQFGDGALLKDGKVDGFFRSVSGSFGLQAGLQRFGYVLFFMTEADLAHLKNTQGLEIGVGPTVTVIDSGLATSITTNTLRDGIFAFFFDQRGLMAGLRLQGTVISRLP